MENSPLKKLPAELRNSIYELALWQSGGVSIGMIQTPQGFRWRSKAPALPSVCRQLRRETVEMFYSINRFTIRTKFIEAYEGYHADTEEDDIMMTRVIDVARCLRAIGHERVKRAQGVSLHIGRYLGDDAMLDFQDYWDELTNSNYNTETEVNIKYHFSYDGDLGKTQEGLSAVLERAQSKYKPDDDMRACIADEHDTICEAVLGEQH
ncbi:hypothetical protein LTR56_023289 [Elasticomyces elasticus]|nr:hypothetical protein LTR56_023289 [Elasticomyces elasticus]KAK4928448.1 hypothetical protein LTR49_004855 [Elasticomyces elasticus]KAK5767249.1 hypothetical protein LTS12_002707 [Elasticomyces elasticus]